MALACALFRRMQAGALQGDRLEEVVDLLEDALVTEDGVNIAVEAQFAVMAEALRGMGEPADLAALDTDMTSGLFTPVVFESCFCGKTEIGGMPFYSSCFSTINSVISPPFSSSGLFKTPLRSPHSFTCLPRRE
jgi:hypothetical protein